MGLYFIKRGTGFITCRRPELAREQLYKWDKQGFAKAETDYIKEGGENMKRNEIRELLCKQLALLAKQSESCNMMPELCELTSAMNETVAMICQIDHINLL